MIAYSMRKHLRDAAGDKNARSDCAKMNTQHQALIVYKVNPP